MVGVTASYVLEGPLVAAKNVDNWLFERNGHIVVITKQGKVFAHDLPRVSRTIGEAYPLPCPENVAANEQDQWVVAISSNIIGVITKDGRLFTHHIDWSTRTVSPHTAWTSPPGQNNVIGTNYPEDWWVLVAHPRDLVVGRRDGGVFVHDLGQYPATLVGAARRENPNGPLVGFNPQDRLVVYDDDNQHLLIITKDGGVFAHKYWSTRIDAAFRLSGNVDPLGEIVPAGSDTNDVRFAAIQNDDYGHRLLLFRANGKVLGYDLDFPLSPSV